MYFVTHFRISYNDSVSTDASYVAFTEIHLMWPVATSQPILLIRKEVNVSALFERIQLNCYLHSSTVLNVPMVPSHSHSRSQV